MTKKRKTILILHRIPYHKIKYHEVIDHDLNDIIYVISSTDDIPNNLCHRVLRVSVQYYIEETICTILIQDIRIDFIIALSEYHLIPADLIRSALGVIRDNSLSVYNCRDKYLMKQCMQQENVKCAWGARLNNPSEIFKFRNLKNFIIKPIRGAASENTRFFMNLNEYSQDYDLQNKLAKNEVFLIEEFITGDIYHFDGLVHNGIILFFIGSKYIGNCLNFVNNSPLASVQLQNINDYSGWVNNCIRAVKIKNGAFHLEGILCGEEMIFLEIGNRAGGAGVVECTKNLIGYNLMQEEVKIMLNSSCYVAPNIPDLNNIDKRYGWFVIPEIKSGFHENSVCTISKIPEITSINISLNRKISDHINYDQEHNSCTGIVTGDNHKCIVDTINDIFLLTTSNYSKY